MARKPANLEKFKYSGRGMGGRYRHRGNKMECWNYPKIGDDEDGDDGDY